MNARQTDNSAQSARDTHEVDHAGLDHPQIQHDDSQQAPPRVVSSQNIAPQSHPSQSGDQHGTSPPAVGRARDYFQDMIKEVLAEEPIFNPLASLPEQSDWSDEPSAHQQINTDEGTSFQATDENRGSEPPQHPQRIDPGSTSGPTGQPTEGKTKGQGPMDNDNVMNPSEQTVDRDQQPPHEDPHAFGALPLPLVDQYPCFAASPDGNGIELDEDALPPILDREEVAINCNLVRVGDFDLDKTLSLAKDNPLTPGSAQTLGKPLSYTVVDPRSYATFRKQNQEQQGVVGEATPAQKLHAKAVSSCAQQTRYAPNTSEKGPQAVKDGLNSSSDGNLPNPTTITLPPALANLQPHFLGHLNNLQPLFSSNQEGLLNSQGITLSSAENSNITRPELSLNSPTSWGNLPQNIACSLSEVSSEKQSTQLQASGFQQKTLVKRCSVGQPISGAHVEGQPNLLPRPSLPSLSIRRNQSTGNFRSPHGTRNMNLSVPLKMKGRKQVTPTSIVCRDLPFQFQVKPGLAGGVQNASFGTQQTSMDAQMASRVSSAGVKRGGCDIGTSCTKSTKEARLDGLNLADHCNVKREDTSSQSSRILHMQPPLYQFPHLSKHSNHTTLQNKSSSSRGQVQDFAIGMQVPQTGETGLCAYRQVRLSNMGGQKSEATVSSPSKPRSTNVRDERGQLPKRYVCEECAEAFAFKENCERHFKVAHQNRTVYFCYHCPASYLQSKTMRLHVEKKHHKIDGENSVFPCYWCDFKTNTDSKWSEHVLEMHPGHKNKFRGGA